MCFWTKCSVCVYLFSFISLHDWDRVWLWNYHRFRVLQAVDSLKVKHEWRSKKVKQFCIKQTFPNDISCFVFLNRVMLLYELKQISSEVTGRLNGWSIQNVTEGVITTRSNRMKFRLTRGKSWMTGKKNWQTIGKSVLEVKQKAYYYNYLL